MKRNLADVLTDYVADGEATSEELYLIGQILAKLSGEGELD